MTENNNKGEWKTVQFHPSYNYDDFIRGIITKPTEDGKGVIYEVKNKILAEFAEEAKQNPDQKYVLIIDEINRANLPAVFEELIYALEYQGEKGESMYSHPKDGQELELPENLYIIGKMNTADRSAGHINYAIRRRFAFITLKSNKDIIRFFYKEKKTKRKT